MFEEDEIKYFEEWKPIKDFPNYQVSNLGRVKSLNYHRTGKEKILKSALDGRGYLQVKLYKDGKQTTKRVHRLVAEAFIPNTENKDDVDHINTIRTDNRVSNLRWCTRRENCNNPISIAHYSENASRPMKGRYGKDNPTSKTILQYSLDGELIREWNSLIDAERELGIHYQSICQCCSGKYHTAGGFIWSYK